MKCRICVDYYLKKKKEIKENFKEKGWELIETKRENNPYSNVKVFTFKKGEFIDTAYINKVVKCASIFYQNEYICYECYKIKWRALNNG